MGTEQAVRSWFGISVGSLCASAALSGGALGQVIQDVGLLPGGTISEIRGLSQDGSVAAGMANTTGGAWRAVRWTTSGGLASIGTLHNHSKAFAINSDGSVVAGETTVPSGATQAFRWTSTGGMTALPTLPGGVTAVAFRCSADGNTIVGYANTSTTVNAFHAFRWTTTGGLQDINSSIPGAISYAYGVDWSGNVITGLLRLPSTPDRLFRWTPSTGMQDLGGLPGANLSFGWAVSGTGNAITGSSQVTGDGMHAVRWTQPAGLQDLGGGGKDGRAMNSDGTVVVGNQGSGAYIHSQFAGTLDLTQFLTVRGANTLGWTLTQCWAISPDGTALAGIGHNALGTNRGWVVRNLPCLQGPVLFSGAANQSVCQGATVTFSVSAGGTNTGTISYQWNGPFGPVVNGVTPSGSFVSGAGTNSITISNVQPADAGYYSYIVSNWCGYVSSGPLLTVTPAPSIVTEPNATSVCLGGTANFTMSAGGGGPFAYQWERHQYLGPVNVYVPISDGPSGFGSSYSGCFTPTLTISNVGTYDLDRYRCRVYGPCGEDSTARVLLSAIQAPVFTTHPPLYTTSCKGGTFSLSAAATGNPFLQYIWAKDNNLLFDGTSCGSTISGSGTQTLTVSNAAGSDSGVYQCYAYGTCEWTLSLGGLVAVCVADVDDGSSTGTCDGGVTIDDLLYFMNLIEIGDPAGDIDDGSFTGTPDCGVTIDDLLYYLYLFENGC